MQLYEGKNNWNNFGEDYLKWIECSFDGAERLSLVFGSSQGNDRCEVVLDWEEEIASFRQLFEELYYRQEKQCKLYPDDYRGLMMRGAYGADRFELTFLKNYQCVRVVMGIEKSRQLLETLERMFAEPKKYVINFSS
ncbi:MAG: hypothetical protein GXX09_08240 [Syntrophomonadaceae bacterium]|nr:hypothetical protein [Syntrophomonadaceae bacterium]